MKFLITLLGAILSLPLITSCTQFGSTVRETPAYTAFKQRPDYPKTSAVFKDDKIYNSALPSNTRIRIDLSDQRAQLLVGTNQQVAIDTPICTGRSGRRTPARTYQISQKTANKRSTIYGSTYYRGRKVHGGDRRKYRGRRDRFVGARLPYWMRLTSDGIGMHGSSSVKRYPASGGCVRTPHGVIPQIYRRVEIGTPVEIVQ